MYWFLNIKYKLVFWTTSGKVLLGLPSHLNIRNPINLNCFYIHIYIQIYKYTDGTGVVYYLGGLVVRPALHINMYRKHQETILMILHGVLWDCIHCIFAHWCRAIKSALDRLTFQQQWGIRPELPRNFKVPTSYNLSLKVEFGIATSYVCCIKNHQFGHHF